MYTQSNSTITNANLLKQIRKGYLACWLF